MGFIKILGQNLGSGLAQPLNLFHGEGTKN
jgi:hypothetical protein